MRLTILQTDPRVRTWLVRIRKVTLVLVLALSIAKFATTVHEHYPIQHWLFWRYARAWGLTLAVSVACFMSGGAALRALKIRLPRLERWYLAFAAGLLLFFLSMFVCGLFRLYGPVLSIALPVLLAASGFRWRRVRRLWPVARKLVKRPVRLESPGAVVLGLLGLCGLALIYIPTLTPANMAADAYWYHQTLAQHYAAAGGIIRSAEGSFVATYPQLATVVYTWAHVLPSVTFFDRIETAAHLEVMVFLWTLLGAGVLAARLVPRRRVGMLWTGVFLFPGIFLYDSSLSLAADHFLALWGPGILLTLFRVFESFDLRRCFLFAAMLAGAMLTKYQAGCLVVVPIIVFVVRTSALTIRAGSNRARGVILGTALLTGLSVLLLWAPHWAKNAIWHHDPFYPLLHDVLPSKPWVQGVSLYFDTVFLDNLWRPVGTLQERLWETTRALVTFSFEPHDWDGFHGKVPVFGSLFTLTSFCLPFVAAGRKLWGAVLYCYGGLFIWYWGSHQDRYLQALMPVMAAATAAVIAKIWQHGLVARAAGGALIGLQVIWGSDVPFIPTHGMAGTTPFQKVLELSVTGYQKNYFERLRPFSWWWKMKKRLPAGAKSLVHGIIAPLGLECMVVSDFHGWIGGIHYGFMRSAAELHRSLRSMEVTHVIWVPDWTMNMNSFAEELVFYSFVAEHVENTWSTENRFLARRPARPPPEKRYGSVLFWGMGDSYDNGLYALEALTVPDYGRHTKADYPAPLERARKNADALLSRAEFAVVDPRQPGAPVMHGFRQIMRRGDYVLWVRSSKSSP
jgi:hypothetical protein